MGFLHHGNKQPGETYYYSPLGVFIFDITNYANEKLNSYVYDDGEAKKGGSLIYKNWVEEGIIKQWEDSGKIPGNRLTLVFDNCFGQNKNHMVLCMGLLLIDIDIFKEVKIMF